MRNESGKFVKSCIIMRRGAELILENYGCFFGNLDFFSTFPCPKTYVSRGENLCFPIGKRTFRMRET